LFVVLPHEKTYLEHLPDSQQYYKSFMHRDVVNFVVFTKYVFGHAYSLYFPIACANPLDCTRTEFLITTSVDGHLKLWKKQDQGIEFVKHYRAHLTPIAAVSASADGLLFATVSEDQTAKVYDVVNFGIYDQSYEAGENF
jgi:peptidylprolyl isomerase domain and WD repeat-containing protein 1